MADAAKKPVHPLPPPAVLHVPGATKAAMWLLSTDEQTAVQALSLLSGDEIIKLRKSVETMQKMGPDQLASIHGEFNRLLEEQPLRMRGSVEYLGSLATKALGEARAAALMTPRDALPPSAMLMEADVEVLATLLGEEHPQVIAAVMATLSPTRACEVLLKLPEALRKEVITRVARLHKVPQVSLARAQQVLSAGLPVSLGEDYEIDGVRIAASMLNELEADKAEGILTDMGQDPLVGDVRQAMFTFDDLSKLDKRGLQALLKEVASDRLIVALKAASDELKAKIFEGLSKRAAEMMKEDLQMMGPTRLADVEAAQKEIVEVALKLRSDGKITVVGAGGDFV